MEGYKSMKKVVKRPTTMGGFVGNAVYQTITEKISYAGKNTNNLVANIVGGTVLMQNSKKGDVVMMYNDDAIHCEVKKAIGGTANQVRPVDYLTLIMVTNDGFIVVPACDVVEHVIKTNKRGQHCPDAMICTNFNVGEKWLVAYKCNTEKLAATIVAAHIKSHNTFKGKLIKLIVKDRKTRHENLIRESNKFGMDLFKFVEAQR